MNERLLQLHRLREKVADLTYRVESFGSLGDERELHALQGELEELEAESPRKKLYLVA